MNKKLLCVFLTVAMILSAITITAIAPKYTSMRTEIAFFQGIAKHARHSHWQETYYLIARRQNI